MNFVDQTKKVHSIRISQVLCVLPLLLLFACGGRKDDLSDSGKTVFRYNEAAGISKLDPSRTASFEDIIAIGHLFEGLVGLDEDMKVIPSIAASYEMSDNELEYTFHLRSDVYFHDDACFPASEGRRVVASDFEYSFFRIVDPAEPSPGKYIFENVEKSERSNFLGFKAMDDHTFKIFLKRPQPSFIQMLTLRHCSVVPHEAVDMYGENFRAHPIGTGPFKFSFWDEGVKLVLLKNESYWRKSKSGDQLPYLDAITISFLPDRLQEFLKFESGKFEMMSGLDPVYQEKILTDMGDMQPQFDETVTFSKIPWLKTDYLGFLVDGDKPVNKNSPIMNKLVRKAINYAINRDELVLYMRKSIGTPGQMGFLPKGMPGFEHLNVDGYTYDQEKARALLRQAGYKGQKIKLIVANQYKLICDYIQRKLNEVGLEVKVDAVSKSVHRKDMATFQANFFLKNWTADFPDATNFYQLYYSKNFSPENGPNYTHFSNVEYDKNFELLLEESNDTVKWDLYNKLEAILIDEAPIVPLFYDETVRFYRSTVTGIKVNSMNQLDLSEVRIQD
ncbi:MAG: ABC transporter substrate-binding protein [Flavobacteriales bacterium]|nr:ABC transporter substrate-binding protein [Flavobacteriales bacterium]